MREELNGILASRSGQDIKVVARDTDRDNFMSAQDAVEYGLIDEVPHREPVETSNGGAHWQKIKTLCAVVFVDAQAKKSAN